MNGERFGRKWSGKRGQMRAAGRERLRCGAVGRALAAFLMVSPIGVAQTGEGRSPQAAPMTAEQDHQRLMDLLHIASLRRGPNGDPKAPDAANVDEAKVPAYTLPDPLMLKNGKRVTDAEMWWKLRRPEIVAEFDREIYGREPKNTPKVKWEVVGTVREEKGGIAVITKNLIGHVDNSAYPAIKVEIELTLTTPEKANGPVPVMMELGWSAKMLEALRSHFTAEQWGEFIGKGPSWQQQVLARGWGYATLIPVSVQ